MAIVCAAPGQAGHSLDYTKNPRADVGSYRPITMNETQTLRIFTPLAVGSATPLANSTGGGLAGSGLAR